MKFPSSPLAGLLVTSALVTIVAITANAQERSPIYPYDVTVGGQQAEPPGGPAVIFANVPQPIAPDARVNVDTEGEQIIVNVFAIDEKGAPLPGAQGQAKVILVQKGTGFDLDATMDKSKLAPGRYGMNIVLQNKGTSRVRFVVGTAEQLAAVGKKGNPPGSDSPPSAKAPPAKINMAGVDRIGGSSAEASSTVPAPSQETLAPPAINLYGSERLGVTPPPLSAATTSATKMTATAPSNRSTPDATMQLFIDLAKAGKFEAIRELESPDADGDVREICAIGDAPDEDKLRYQTFFGGGKVLGEPRIDGDKAEVDFTMGDNQERKETMNLERIAGLWFLSNF